MFGKKIIKRYYFLIGLIILAIIFSQLNFADLLKSFQKINYYLLALGISLVIPSVLIKSWRWNYLKKSQGIKYQLLDSFLIYNVGFLLGGVTPSQVGELAKVYYLKKGGLSYGKATVSIIIDRVFDIFYFLIFGYLGIIFVLKDLRNEINLFYFISLILLLIIIIILKLGWHKMLFNKIFCYFVPENYQKKLHLNFNDFISDLKLLTLKNYFIAFLITVLAWLLYYLQMEIFALSLGLEIPIINLAVAVTITGLVSLLPISILGIGTREATLILLLQPFYSNISIIIIFSQLILVANLVGYLLGAVSWLFLPFSLKTIKNYEKN